MIKKIIIICLLFALLFINDSCSATYSYELFNLGLTIRNYIKTVNYKLKPYQINKIAESIINQSQYYNIPWYVTLAIIEAESEFNQFAISEVGAKGLMQIYTMECFGVEADEKRLFEIDYNIAFGLCIFSDKLRISKNDYTKAISMYNGKGKNAKKYMKKVLNNINKIKDIFYK